MPQLGCRMVDLAAAAKNKLWWMVGTRHTPMHMLRCRRTELRFRPPLRCRPPPSASWRGPPCWKTSTAAPPPSGARAGKLGWSGSGVEVWLHALLHVLLLERQRDGAVAACAFACALLEMLLVTAAGRSEALPLPVSPPHHAAGCSRTWRRAGWMMPPSAPTCEGACGGQ